MMLSGLDMVAWACSESRSLSGVSRWTGELVSSSSDGFARVHPNVDLLLLAPSA